MRRERVTRDDLQRPGRRAYSPPAIQAVRIRTETAHMGFYYGVNNAVDPVCTAHNHTNTGEGCEPPA